MVAAGLQPGKEGERTVNSKFLGETFLVYPESGLSLLSYFSDSS